MHRRLILAVAAAMLLVAGGGAAWLLGTQSGLHGLFWLLSRLPAVEIRATGLHGSLLGGTTIEQLVVMHERATVDIRRLETRLEPAGLLIGLLQLSYVNAASVAVTVMPRRHPPDNTPIVFLPRPLRIDAATVRVALLRVRTAGGAVLEFHDAVSQLALSPSRLDGHAARVQVAGWSVGGDMALVGARELGYDGKLTLAMSQGGGFKGDIRLRGTLARLTVDAVTRVPSGAHFSGWLQLEDRLAVDGKLAVDGFDPAVFGASSALGSLSGQLRLAGSLDHFRVEGSLATSRLADQPATVVVEGAYADRVLTVKRLSATGHVSAGQRRPQLSATGQVDFHEPSRIDIRASWRDLRWPLQAGAALVESPEGELTLAGSASLAYQLNGRFLASGIPPATVTARGLLRHDGLSVDALEADVASGTVSARGDLEFGGQRRWHAQLEAHGVDPGVVRTPLHGRINVSVQGDGEGFSPMKRLVARISRFDGTVRGLPASGSGRVTAQADNWRFDDVRLVFGSANLRAHGEFGEHTQFGWQLRVDRLGDFVAGGGGSLRSDGSLSGNGATRAVRGTLIGHNLAYKSLRAAQLSAEVDFDGSDARPSLVKALVTNIAYDGYQLDQFRVVLDGRSHAHSLLLHLQQGKHAADLSGHGAYEPGRWTTELEEFHVAGPPLWSYRLAAPSTLTVSAAAIALTSTCLVRDESRLCGGGSWSKVQPWVFSVDATALPLQFAALRLPPDLDYGGTAHVEAHLRGGPGQVWTGDATADLADAEFRYKTASGHIEAARLGAGRLALVARPDNHVASLGFATLGGSFVSGTLAIGREGTLGAGSPLEGNLTLATTEFGWLPVIVPGIDRFAGRVDGQAHVGGTLGAPLVGGTVHLTAGEIDIFRTNLLLRSIDATLSIEGDALGLRARAATRGGTATAEGRLAWKNRAPSGRLDFKGENLLVADLPEARVVASPQLVFTVERNRINVTGDVRIPSARIVPLDLRNAVLRSRDERLVGDNAPAPAGDFQVDASLKLILGDEVSIDAYGLKGKLGGNLLISARENEVAAASGEINIRQGKYTVYTRELDIDRGRLLFAGQSIGNPGVDIRAQRKMPSVTAGVNVRGTLLAPQISFYSEPALSQSQIAAILIIGRTLDDIQDTTAASSVDSRKAVVAQGGALLGAQLGRYVGVSDVAVEEDVNKSTSIVIGKFLSPRLYVSYGVSLTEAINTLKLRYSIGDRWVIRTESGGRQSIDVEYTIGR